MKVYLFLLCLILCSVIPFIDASQQSLGTFKQNTCVNLIQTCDNCTYVNLTQVQVPNSNIVTLSVNMENHGQNFNHTFCSTSQIGTYVVSTCGDPAGVKTCDSYDFVITPSGSSNNPNFYYMIFIVSLGIMILGFAISNGWITILGTFGFIYLGLYILLYGLNGMKDTVYTWGFGILILAVGGYIGIKSAYEMIEEITLG